MNRLQNFILVFLLLSGCAKKEKKEIELSLFYWGDSEEINIMKRMAEAFETENTGIDVKLIHANNYQDKLQVMIGGGIPPDVFYLEAVDIPAYASTLVDIEPFLEDDTLWNPDDYFEALLKGFEYEGKFYGIPKDWTPLVLYYNKALFDEAGVSYPDGSWDWQALLKAAKRLTKDLDGDGKPDQFGIYYYTSWLFPLFPWIWSNGGRILSEDRKRCVIDSPETVEALQFLADMRWKYGVTPTPVQIAQRDLFTTGRVAMLIMGRWGVPRYRTIKDFEWDIAPVPKNKCRATSIASVAFVISAKCKYPKEAYRLAMFLSGEEGNRIIARMGLGVPSIKEIAYSEDFLTPDEPPAHGEVFLDAAKYGRLEPTVPQWREMANIIGTELDKVWLNHNSAEEVCKELVPKVNKLLAGSE
ncbi:hypothetical protein CH333_04875 [candidate division WOR-3 bacterium JGI_Cruoil_03_44_89]|mgnify:CR=1 FL=1|uniref:Sugar ABC transporter substrate-binding protein n=1 Tax=candidate division WOR-3 bacterium JGI_Cruoil_03_44_89 TaxID=1973748 RepID=A0A235BU92_UNCW3|nr:MAG: hypothetical protein CH333_04875 [candidate division WOR-3 bacterium JGI_Cruoil_03_44_89]